MTADSIILKVAVDLGKNGLVKYLKSGVSADVESDEKEKERLLVCLDLVLGELYRTKSKTYYTQEFNVANKFIPISSFAHKPLKIQSVTFGGEKTLYEILPSGIGLWDNGKFQVKYTYIPERAEGDVEIDLDPSVTERAVKCGTLAEYCLSAGMFEESARWRAEFEREMTKVLKSGYVKERRLV